MLRDARAASTLLTRASWPEEASNHVEKPHCADHDADKSHTMEHHNGTKSYHDGTAVEPSAVYDNTSVNATRCQVYSVDMFNTFTIGSAVDLTRLH